MKRHQKRSGRATTTGDSPVEAVRARDIGSQTKLALVANAAGRCQREGCNKYILEHPVSHEPGMFGEAAHVVAFKRAGPRGEDGERPANIHALANLMFLCAECHHEIDTNTAKYPRERLMQQKAAHEQRVRVQTEIGPDRQTATFILKAPIGGHAVAIGQADIAAAVLPRFTNFRNRAEVDLTGLVGQRENADFLRVAKEQIDRGVQDLFRPGGDAAKLNHVSVFGLGPIALLMHLGSRLTNKVPMDFYQRHRDTEAWTWKTDGEPVAYIVRRVRLGQAGEPVSLALSLSGTIAPADLPAAQRDSGSVYEITLENRNPDPTFLRQRVDLEGFRGAFQEAIGLITRDHGLIDWIDIFPAVPAPIAILCGRERLPKAHPGFRVFDRTPGGYIYQLEVI